MEIAASVRTNPGTSEGFLHTKNGDDRLNNDVWLLILGYLHPKDLFCVCLVSRRLYHLAILPLYHTITVKRCSREEWKEKRAAQLVVDGNNRKRSNPRWSPWGESLTLIRRLTRERHGGQARAVREVEVSPFDKYYRAEEDAALDPKVVRALARLVKALPNLRHFRLWSPASDVDALIRALNDQPRHPALHLLCEDGSRVVAGPMPSVTTIRARVNPYAQHVGGQPSRRMLDLQTLFFACPNLKSFSISLYGNYGGCIVNRHRLGCDSFELAGHETFPSTLESLSLDGYPMTPKEWDIWRNKVNWSGLSDLRLGPQRNTHLLHYFRGHATALRSLTVETWAAEGSDHCPELEEFLLCFDSLEQLTVRGHFVSNRALCHHTRLKRLCLHAIEINRSEAPRPTMAVDDLCELDTKCPDLEDLELDIYRDGNGWPQDIVRALASGFPNLQQLALHSEVGINFAEQMVPIWSGSVQRVLLPALDLKLAWAFAEPFFAWRRPGSKLKSLSLRTGERLRRFPQRTPAYRHEEISQSVAVHVRAPRDGTVALDVIDVNDPRSEFFRS